MTPLRWIVAIAGAVLLAAIYLFERHTRRTNSSDQPDLNRSVVHAIPQDDHIPQLDQPIRVRARVEQPVTIERRDSDSLDELPPMHANADANVAPASRESFHAAPVVDISLLKEPNIGSLDTAVVNAVHAQRNEPVMTSTTPVNVAITADTAALDTPAASRMPKKTATARKIVALRLAAGSERVEGARLKSLLEAAGLRHGRYSIYHRLHDNTPLFSVASMVEPGTFDPYAMNGVQFPGVTIFAQLPGPIAGDELLAQMLSCARELEQGMGGLLQDERGLPLTDQREQRMREDVANFMHLLGIR